MQTIPAEAMSLTPPSSIPTTIHTLDSSRQPTTLFVVQVCVCVCVCCQATVINLLVSNRRDRLCK